jgi:magnesium transporter
MRAFIFAGGSLRETASAADVRAARAAGELVWVDLETQSVETDALLTDTFALHPLTIEDIWATHATPKIDEFDSYLYVMVHAAERGRGAGEITTCELDVVIGTDFVITHDQAGRTTPPLGEDVKRTPRILSRGTAWFAHALLDRLVDAYTPAIEKFDEEIETLQDDVLAKAGTREGTELLAHILALKRGLQGLRRVSIHQRELFLRLSRGEFAAIPPDALPYFRDVHDHFIRIGDLADSYRDLLASSLDAYLSVQSNRMNQVMKTLTLISTVMLPITFIAGVYGMNFDHMPELHWRYGYAFAIALMASVAAGVVFMFHRKRWLD